MLFSAAFSHPVFCPDCEFFAENFGIVANINREIRVDKKMLNISRQFVATGKLSNFSKKFMLINLMSLAWLNDKHRKLFSLHSNTA